MRLEHTFTRFSSIVTKIPTKNVLFVVFGPFFGKDINILGLAVRSVSVLESNGNVQVSHNRLSGFLQWHMCPNIRDKHVF